MKVSHIRSKKMVKKRLLETLEYSKINTIFDVALMLEAGLGLR